MITLDEVDLTDIFRTFHQNAEYTFFSSAHGTFFRIDHMAVCCLLTPAVIKASFGHQDSGTACGVSPKCGLDGESKEHRRHCAGFLHLRS